MLLLQRSLHGASQNTCTSLFVLKQRFMQSPSACSFWPLNTSNSLWLDASLATTQSQVMNNAQRPDKTLIRLDDGPTRGAAQIKRCLGCLEVNCPKMVLCGKRENHTGGIGILLAGSLFFHLWHCINWDGIIYYLTARHMISVK